MESIISTVNGGFKKAEQRYNNPNGPSDAVLVSISTWINFPPERFKLFKLIDAFKAPDYGGEESKVTNTSSRHVSCGGAGSDLGDG